MKFTFQEIASAGTGFLFGVSETDNGIGGVYRVLNFMTGDDLFTHQLPRALTTCQPAMFVQHTWLKDLRDVLKYSQERYSEEEYMIAFKCAELKYKSIHGDEFELVPLAEWEKKNPIADLMEMRDKEVIVIMTGKDTDNG
jgi:hypothetical protein